MRVRAARARRQRDDRLPLARCRWRPPPPTHTAGAARTSPTCCARRESAGPRLAGRLLKALLQGGEGVAMSAANRGPVPTPVQAGCPPPHTALDPLPTWPLPPAWPPAAAPAASCRGSASSRGAGGAAAAAGRRSAVWSGEECRPGPRCCRRGGAALGCGRVRRRIAGARCLRGVLGRRRMQGWGRGGGQGGRGGVHRADMVWGWACAREARAAAAARWLRHVLLASARGGGVLNDWAGGGGA